MSSVEIVAFALIGCTALFWLVILIFSAPMHPEEDQAYGDTTGYDDAKK